MKSLPPLSLGMISRYRNVLYGFSALWIFSFHAWYVIPPSHPVLRLFQSSGNCGVDIFFFLSAMGLYYSMEKNPRVGQFYRKRLSRLLLPAAVFVLIFFATPLSSTTTPRSYLSLCLQNLFLVNENSYIWYVPACLYLYLAYPLIYRVLKKRPACILAASGVSVVLLFVMRAMWPDFYYTRRELWLTRIPLILFACWAAPYIKEDRPLPRWFTPVPLMGCFLSFGLNIVGRLSPWNRFVLIPMSLSLILLICQACMYLQKWNFFSFLLRILSWIGGYSLELYLVQRELMRGILHLPYVKDDQYKIMTALSLVLVLITAVALQKFCNTVRKEISQIRLPDLPGSEPGVK